MKLHEKPGNHGTTWVHPELGSDEIYLGNLSADSYAACCYGSKRMGLKIFDTKGIQTGELTDVTDPMNSGPVFISRTEYEAFQATIAS